MLRRVLVLLFALTLTASITHAQEEVDLTPIKDNTLYEHESGELSNGAGEALFAGRVGPGQGGTIRRAVIAFDVASAVPEGVTVSDVVLTLFMSMTGSGTQSTSVHRVTSEWGEGTSDATGDGGGGGGGVGTESTSGDATWIHTFYDSETWETPGGDFVQTASATLDVGAVGEYTFTSDGMVADVQQWLDDPSSNFGWILIGNEASNSTSKRFDSRENPTEENRPRLTITYVIDSSTEQPEHPSTLHLAGNYPNPFVDATTVRFDLERPQSISLRIYDVLGREVRSNAGDLYLAGPHELAIPAAGLPAGTYLYCLEGTVRTCGRMALLR